jgi:hypothetical protein
MNKELAQVIQNLTIVQAISNILHDPNAANMELVIKSEGKAITTINAPTTKLARQVALETQGDHWGKAVTQFSKLLYNMNTGHVEPKT